MFEIVRSPDPITGIRNWIEVKGPKKVLSKLAYDNHLEYEYTKEGIKVRSTKLVNILEILQLHEYKMDDPHLKKRAKELGMPKVYTASRGEIAEPSFKHNPFIHQVEAAQFALKNTTALIADKMGKGKTFTGMIIAETLADTFNFKHTLVLNGVSSNQYNWKKEVEKFSYKKGYIIGEREIKQGPRAGSIRVGSNPDKLKDLQEGIDAHYLIANIHMLRDRKILDQLKKMVEDGDIGYIIVDEVHKCVGITAPKDLGKNKKTKVPALQELRPVFRTAMSGTPFNEPTDLYDIELWLGRAHTTRSMYESRYGEHVVDTEAARFTKRRGGFLPTKFLMTKYDLFKKEIARYMIRRDSTEGLPPITFENHYVDLYREQVKALDEISTDLTLKDLASMTLEQMQDTIRKPEHMEKRRIVSFPHSMGIEKDAKLDALQELIEEIEANNDTAIVFTYFSETPDYYAKNLKADAIYITSKDNTDEVFKKVDRFQSGEGCILVGGYGKIGTGLNIERADYIIFVDTPITWNDYEQAIYRVLRGTRKDPVTVIKLIAVGTYDEIMQHNVAEKKMQSDMVLGKTISDTAVK